MEWNTFLLAAMFTYNILKHSTIRHTPFQLIYGRHSAVHRILYLLLGDHHSIKSIQYMSKSADTLIKLQDRAFSKISLHCGKAHAADATRRRPLAQFEVSDAVAYCDV